MLEHLAPQPVHRVLRGDRQQAATEPHRDEPGHRDDEHDDQVDGERGLVAIGDRTVDDRPDEHGGQDRQQRAREAQDDHGGDTSGRVPDVGQQPRSDLRGAGGSGELRTSSDILGHRSEL